MREEELEIGGIYHVFNRGVEKRLLFLESIDYERFLESMFIFNDRDYRSKSSFFDRVLSLANSPVSVTERFPLVRILAFCLMPNHFHLMLQQLEENGISRFMHKLGMGYSKHFNAKQDRTGRLYESPFQAVSVDSEEHLEHLPIYIHLNALDLTPLNWRDGLVHDWKAAIQFLDQYPWSSHHAYMGQEQSLPMIDYQTIRDVYSSNDDYLGHIRDWSGRELNMAGVFNASLGDSN